MLAGCGSEPEVPETSPGAANTAQFEEMKPEVGPPSAADLDRLGPKNDLDTVGLLNDAVHVMLVQPRRFLASPFGAGNADLMNHLLFQLMKTPVAFDRLERLVIAFRQPIGVPVQQMGQDGKPMLAMVPMMAKSTVLTLLEPTTPERFFAEIMPLPPQLSFDKLVTSKVGDREYYDYAASLGVKNPVTIAVHFASDRKIVVVEGDNLTISDALSGKPASGATIDRLGRIDLNNTDLAMIVSREGVPLRSEEMRQFLSMTPLPPPLIEALMYTRAMQLRLDSHATENVPLIGLSIDTTEPKGLQELSEQIQAWIISGQGVLASTPAVGLPNLPIPPAIANELLAALSVDTEGSIVRLTLKNAPALKDRYLDLVRDIRKMQRLGDIRGRIVNIAQGFVAEVDKNKAFPHAIASADGKPFLSWRVAILPKIGYEELYKQFKIDEPWDSPNNKPLLEKMPPVFAIPEENASASTKTRFRIFNAEGTPFGKKDLKPEDILSPYTTAMIVVVAPDQAVEWTEPDVLAYKPDDPNFLKTLFGDTFMMFTCGGEFLPAPLAQIPPEMLDVWITGKIPPQAQQPPPATELQPTPELQPAVPAP